MNRTPIEPRALSLLKQTDDVIGLQVIKPETRLQQAKRHRMGPS